MKKYLKSVCLLIGSGSAIAGYWIANDLFGPFSAVRRYGRMPGGPDWAFSIPKSELLWYASGLFSISALVLVFFGLSHIAPQLKGRKPRQVGFICAIAAILFSFALRLGVLHGAPTCDDEMVYQFQARTLASGHLTAAPPPDPKAFEHLFLGIYKGHWFGQYNFGHPLFLAIGEILRAIDLVDPILTGILVMAVFLLAERLFGRQAAMVSAVLAAISPMFISTGATLLSQNSATPLILFSVITALVAASSGRFVHAFFSALLLGAAAWSRGQEPVLLGLCPMILIVLRIIRGPSRINLIAGITAGAVLSIGPLLLLQWHLWGNPFWTNYQAYWWGYLNTPLRSPYGFGPAPWDILHTPAAGLKSLIQNLIRLDSFLIGVPLALVLAAIAFWPERRRPEVLAVFAGTPLTCGVLFFYFWPGLADTGPQLYHAAGAMLLPFVAAGLLRLSFAKAKPILIAVSIALISAATFWPVQIKALQNIAWWADEIPRLVRKAGSQRAIVFTEMRPWIGGYNRCWVLGRPLPEPDLSDPVLYLHTQGKPVDEALSMRLYPYRPAYLLRQIDGKAALVRLEDFFGRDSLLAIAGVRELRP